MPQNSTLYPIEVLLLLFRTHNQHLILDLELVNVFLKDLLNLFVVLHLQFLILNVKCHELTVKKGHPQTNDFVIDVDELASIAYVHRKAFFQVK